jgi:hypothetical protein|tara:strand:+ start:2801 stop:3328 length:528 start_codon:yes stop_codon:yes gene_type:complete
MPSIKNLIPVTVLFVTCNVLFTNYVLLRHIKILPNIPDFFKYLFYSTFFYFIYGFYISYSSSDEKCGKNDKKKASIHAIKSVLYVLVTYTLIYMFTTIRQPFVELLGDNIRTSSIIEIFYISLNLCISVIVNHFDSYKNVCRVTPKELEKNLKQLDKYLSKKQKKNPSQKISVRD